MTYTQMLFALSFDKLIFGHVPDVLSIIGSSIILGSAIVVAIQKDSGSKTEQHQGGNRIVDEEAQEGLLGETSNLVSTEGHDRLPVQEVQLIVVR